MKIAAISELKAKLAQYLRLVKAGEQIEIHERGVPIALLTASEPAHSQTTSFIAPRKSPGRLAATRFSVKLASEVDVVNFLAQDRKKR